MPEQDTPASEYMDSRDNLFAYLFSLHASCIHAINHHPPPLAVSYIVEAIDRLAPHVERHTKARKALLQQARGYQEKTLNPKG